MSDNHSASSSPTDTLARVTSLGRLLDPRYPTHLAILSLSAIGGVVAAVLALMAGASLFPGVLIEAVYGAGAIFIGWLISREIDHDHPYSAFPAALLAFVAYLLLGTSNLLYVALLAVIARMVTRVVGPPARLTDQLVVGVGAAFVMLISADPLVGLVAALAFLFDAVLAEPLRRAWIFVGLMLAATAAVAVLTGWPAPLVSLSTGLMALTGVTAVLFIVMIVLTRDLALPCDSIDSKPHPGRMRAAMTMVLLASIAAALWYGDAGAVALSTAWAAMLATALYRPFASVLPNG